MKPERMIELANDSGFIIVSGRLWVHDYQQDDVHEELLVFANAVIEESTSELQKEVERLTRELAAYEAMPIHSMAPDWTVLNRDTSHIPPNSEPIGWVKLICKPSSTAHLDQLLQQERDKALEEAAGICEKHPQGNLRNGYGCAKAIRAAKKGEINGKEG